MRAQYISALLFGGLAAACPTGPRTSTTTVAAVPAATSSASTAATSTATTTTTTTNTGSSSGSSSSSGSTSSGSTTVFGVDIAAAVAAIMPTSNTCSGAQFPDECRTAAQAAPYIAAACANLTKAECAATVAVMGLESADIKFKHNVSPGRPGQGTANMMMANYVSLYATALFGADKVSGKAPNDVLALVMPDATNFGSAAWFLTSQCTSAVRTALQAGNDAGWLEYNQQCIGVDGSLAERIAYWDRAKTAFGL